MMKDALLKKIEELVKEKEGAKKAPSNILWSDFMNMLRNDLKELHKEGKIHVGRTVNDWYIKLK